MAGVGKLGQLRGYRVTAVEIEPEWAAECRQNGCVEVACCDAQHLPFADASFAVAVTSPTYGNRLADRYAPDVESKRSHRVRRTYRIALGRELCPENAGGMQFGIDYCRVHENVWREVFRVLRPGGVFILNCKDHIRDGKVVEVCLWHWQTLTNIGFVLEDAVEVPSKGDQNTVRMRKKGISVVDSEQVVKWRKPLRAGLVDDGGGQAGEPGRKE